MSGTPGVKQGRATDVIPLPALMRTLGVPSRVSVVVPTYRRPRMLGRCLAALVMQSLPPHAYEIIVCDDGCDGETHAMVASYAERFHPGGWRIVYVPVSDTQGPAGARNRGWHVARSDVIAFTDDDTIPDRHWLERGLAALRGGAAAVAGRIQVPLPAAPTDYELDASGLARAEFATANCFVHRAMLEQIGGFDPRYTSAWREDSDLQFAILRAGGTIGRAEGAVVLHPVRPARFGVSLAQQRKSQFEALLFKNHRKLYRSRVSHAPPWKYYAIIVSAVVTVGALALAAPPVAVTAGTLWALLTLDFAHQRLRNTARTPRHVAEMVVTSIAIPFLSVFWRLYGAVKFRVAFL